jgi:uncharacterized protein YjbI with pentapeptide repeats
VSANLQGAHLTDANLQGAILLRADLQRALLGIADLQGADLRRVNLQGAWLLNATLQGADLGGAILQGAILVFANLQGADLGGANLQGAILENADLQGAILVGANLRRAILVNATLQGAILGSLDLLQEVFTLPLADLQEANLTGAGLQGADLTGVTLQRATLMKANLGRVNLEVADLQGANLQGANLQGAFLEHANLQGANLRFADLREVDLLDVRTGGLLGTRLYRAKLDHTVLKKEQLGPEIGDEQAGEYREARDAYLALKQNFEDLGDYESASWSYIRERRMEKACSAPWRARRFYGEEQLGDTSEHRLPAYHPRVWWFFVRHTRKWLSDLFVGGLCGYGESIGLVLWWMAALLFVSPLLFGLLGLLDWPDKNAETFYSLSVPWRYGYSYLQQFLYVLDAFTTADFAELQPANSLGRLCSGLIALVGIFLTGLLGFVVGNRIRRS